MKKGKIIFLFIVLLTSGLAFSSCGNGSTDSANTETKGKEYTSAYICPMHCEGSGAETAGTCPVCGMDYVKNEDHKTDGDGHEGHNH